MIIENNAFTVAYQITQNCPFNCRICNRRFEIDENELTQNDIPNLIDKLKDIGLKRLTITGGEPMIYWDKVIFTLKYAHSKNVHTCLSTTGHLITYQRLKELDLFLDQLLISIPTLDREKWIIFFGKNTMASSLYDNVMCILNNIKKTNIIIEVCTVITKENKDDILDIGSKLLDINQNIIWKIEYYYPMGINKDIHEKFDISNHDLEIIQRKIFKKFNGCFKHLYITEPIRHKAPNIFITPAGDMVTTDKNSYSNPFGNVLKTDLSHIHFTMNRPWVDYLKYCRNWNW